MAVKISRLLHAGYLFESDGSQIVFDPVFETPFSFNCYPFPAVHFDLKAIAKLNFSAVFISHVHDDHCSLESLFHLNRQTSIFIFSISETVPDLIRALGFTTVNRLQVEDVVVVGAFTVTVHEALDRDIDCVLQISADGFNILNAVDSWIGPDTLKVLKQVCWDLALWPFQTMREVEVLSPRRASGVTVRTLPPEWTEQLTELNPRAVVPSSCQFQFESWSWLNRAFFPLTYRQFESEIKNILPNSSCRRMSPGTSILLKALQEIAPVTGLSWIIPIGDQNLDYEFDEDALAPPTSAVARRLVSLSAAEAERVKRFCQVEISSGLTADDFNEAIMSSHAWRLTTYDGYGEPTHTHYVAKFGKIEIEPLALTPVAWTTEIPAVKLYAALERGESLTSMYIRINDIVFSKAIEEHLKAIDTLCDPLLRALSASGEASYQKAQLKRLLNGSTGHLIDT